MSTLSVVGCMLSYDYSSWFEFKFSLGTKENWICTGKKVLKLLERGLKQHLGLDVGRPNFYYKAKDYFRQAQKHFHVPHVMHI